MKICNHMNSVTGFLFINKPAGSSSFDCLRHIKRLLPRKTPVGHAGTLDVFASGLLIVGIGRAATRAMNDLLALDKKYTFTAKLHELTDTLDYTGKAITPLKCKTTRVTQTQLEHAIKQLGTGYTQTPPIYSSLKHEGENLYKLARSRQIDPHTLCLISQSKSRFITIHKLELIEYSYPFFTCTAHVSKGTYIRSLAHDIAQQHGTVATTYALTRTAIGPITLDQAHTLESLRTHQHLMRALIPLEDLVKHTYPPVKKPSLPEQTMQTIRYEDFENVELRSGAIIKVEPFPRAKNPSYKVWVDFGKDIGIKQTSAQITVNYTPEVLVGRQIIGCINLGTKNIAGFISEFLLVGFTDENGAIRLAGIDGVVPNGQKLH